MADLISASEARFIQAENHTTGYLSDVMEVILSIIEQHDGPMVTSAEVGDIAASRPGADHNAVKTLLESNGYTITGTTISWAE